VRRFNRVVIPITAGRDKSIKLIDDANAAGKIIGVVNKKKTRGMKILKEDINSRYCRSNFTCFKMPDGTTTVILQKKNDSKLIP
jgi:ATP-dependent Lon protease